MKGRPCSGSTSRRMKAGGNSNSGSAKATYSSRRCGRPRYSGWGWTGRHSIRCLADLAGAERAVSTGLALLLGRERGQEAGYAEVSLAEMADEFAVPWRQGLTTPDGVLGGAYAGYDLYRAREGWVALAALEPHFWKELTRELGLTSADRGQLQQAFLAKTAAEWEAWAADRALPLARVREPTPGP